MIRLLVVDDQELVRQGIVALLGFEQDLQVIGQAVDGDDCLAKLPTLKPDVVLLDIRMPILSGVEVFEYISKNLSYTPLI